MSDYLKVLELLFSRKHCISNVYLFSVCWILVVFSNGSIIINSLFSIFPQIASWQQVIQFSIDVLACTLFWLFVLEIILMLVSVPFVVRKKDISCDVPKVILNIDYWLLRLLGKNLNLSVSLGELACALMNINTSYQQVSFLTWQAEFLYQLWVPFNILNILILLAEDYESERLFR